MTSHTNPDANQKVKSGPRLLVGVVLGLGALLVLVVLFGHRGLYHIFRFHQERSHLEQENARLAAENERLARTIDRLQHDPEMIQDLIRRELNFVKKNEIIFQFPPEGQEKSPVTPPSPPGGPPGAARTPSAPAGLEKKGVAQESREGTPKASAGHRSN